MPNVAAGLGLLGLGVMVVVAVGTLAYSLFYEQPRNREEYYFFSPNDDHDHDGGTWGSSSDLPAPSRTVKRKKRQRTCSDFVVNDLCSICKEMIKNDALTKLPCNHCFHYQCIYDWFDACAASVMETGTCPMCRKSFSVQDLRQKCN